MSEGEFKKQIGRWLTLFTDREYYISERHIQQILDEACKDLLEDSYRLKTVICIDYEKWKKWFGGSAEK